MARAIVLRQLTNSPKSRLQLARKLAERNVPEDVAEAVLDRFEEVQLVDDAEFADMWVRRRSQSRKLAKGALRRELADKGIDPETAAGALDQLSDEDEESAARELVQRKLRGLTGFEDRAERDKATRRLASMLARKGYQPSQAFRIVGEVLDDGRGRSGRRATGRFLRTPRRRADPVPLTGEFDHSLPSSRHHPFHGRLVHPGRRARSRCQPRTYQVRTFGCQMNVHDSERMSGMLEAAGYVPAAGELADVVVFNTCAVRENADNKLYGNLGILAPVKAANPGMQIAVGGCLAQKDRDTILKKAPWVDAVFGTHNVGALPALLERARHNNEAQLEILESLDVFPSTLPTKRDSVYSGWVSISVGCNNTCTFCIVPALRGKEKDRRPGDILAEIQALVDDGAIEVTLLGQNVNSYGVEFGDRQAFSKLLRACGDIPGLERVRFTSPHPAAFTDDVIDAMAETPNVMPQLHMPLQSGSDKVLKDMKRSYRSTKFLGILDKVRDEDPARRHLHGHHRRVPR